MTFIKIFDLKETLGFRILELHKICNMENLIHKVQENGVLSLTDSELLSVFINTDKVKYLYETYGYSLANLSRIGFEELKNLGFTKRECLLLVSIFEISRRKKYVDSSRINSSIDIFNYMSPLMSDLYFEEVWAIFLNSAGRIIAKKKIGQGGIDTADCDVKILFYHALMYHARTLILVHNHPSGNIKPSRQDDRLTDSVNKIAEIHGIKFLDHVIIANDKYYSYVDEGRI